MRKELKVIGLIIFGCIILIVGFLSIRYVIHSDGDMYSADADYVSIYNVEDAYEESQDIIHENIEKESFAEAFESFITEDPAVELDEETTKDESDLSQDDTIKESVDTDATEPSTQDDEVVDEQANEVVSEESIEETVLYEEPNEEKSVTDETLIDAEITEYTGDEYIDTTIHEHRDEIADEDIVFGLSIADRIDINMVYSYMEAGLTDEERGALSQYLHSLLTEAEYAKLKELFYKYNYILE